MKTKILLLLTVSFSLLVTAQKDGKYIFTKSGHIEFNLTGNTIGKKTVWYDDYGIKMATLTDATSTTSFMGITNTTVEKELEIKNGNQLWKINLIDKTGTKTTIDYAIKTGKALTDKKSDAELHEMERQAILDMNGKIEGYENFLRKKCLVFTFGTTKFWQYKGYPLKSEISMMGITNNETAISFDENIAVPASKFDVPAGITITEFINPMDGSGSLLEMFGQIEEFSGNEEEQDQENEYTEPLHTDLIYDDFINAVNGIKIPGFKRTASEESVNNYLTMFRINDQFGGISIMNTDVYDNAEEGETIEVQRTYTLDGKKTKYALTHEGENETKMHSIFIEYPTRKMTVLINADRRMPLSTMEEIARQLNF